MTDDENISLHAAAASGDANTVRALLNQGADVNGVDIHGLTALYWAVSYGWVETVRVLIEQGADKNAKRVVGDMGNSWTPLHIAAEHDQVECTRLLLKAGADPDPKDEFGQTPLFLAADQEHNHGARRAKLKAADVARLLIEHGADVKGTAVSQFCTGSDPGERVEARLEALEMLMQATEEMR